MKSFGAAKKPGSDQNELQKYIKSAIMTTRHGKSFFHSMKPTCEPGEFHPNQKKLDLPIQQKNLGFDSLIRGNGVPTHLFRG